jgi:hypothetical protein
MVSTSSYGNDVALPAGGVNKLSMSGREHLLFACAEVGRRGELRFM